MKRFVAAFTTLLLVCLPLLAAQGEIDTVAGEQLRAMQAMVRASESITLYGIIETEYTLGGTSVPLTNTNSVVVFLNPLITHSIIADSTGVTTETFVIQQGDQVHLYSDQPGVVQLPDVERVPEGINDMGGDFDILTHVLDDLASATIIGEEVITVNGIEFACMRILAEVNVDRLLEEMIFNTLVATPADDSDMLMDIQASLIELTVPFEYWIDNATGKLVQYTYDYQKIMSGIFDFVPDDLDAGFTFSVYKATYQVIAYDSAEEIVIPAKYIASGIK